MVDPYIDLGFGIQGSRVPLDHGYVLYAALSEALPLLHQANWIGVHPLTGLRVGRDLQLSRTSRLRLRLPASRIPEVLALTGKRLGLNRSVLRVGVPEIHPLHPVSALRARLVNIKGFTEAEPFLEALQRQLAAMGVQGAPHLGRRRVMRIKDKTIVGFQVVVSELTAEESMTLQERGLGGRRRMGCGMFVPVRSAMPPVRARSG